MLLANRVSRFHSGTSMNEFSICSSVFFFNWKYFFVSEHSQLIIYLFIYLRILGSQKPGKAHRVTVISLPANRETLTDDKRRRITWNK